MQGKSIIVTGAAGILGRAVVERLSLLGASVIAVDISTQAPAIGEVRFVGGVDLADPGSVEQAAILTQDADLHGLVNIAGGFRWETLGDSGVDGWDMMYRMNVRSTASMCGAMLANLRRGRGAIVNIGAAATAKAAAGMGPYTASKAGVARLTEALAEEEKGNGVRVNAILPTIIDTPANRTDMPDADISAWVTPGSIADVVAFLLSSQARAINGASILVSGRDQTRD